MATERNGAGELAALVLSLCASRKAACVATGRNEAGKLVRASLGQLNLCRGDFRQRPRTIIGATRITGSDRRHDTASRLKSGG